MLKIINSWLFHKGNTYESAKPIYYILRSKFIDNEMH